MSSERYDLQRDRNYEAAQRAKRPAQPEQQTEAQKKAADDAAWERFMDMMCGTGIIQRRR